MYNRNRIDRNFEIETLEEIVANRNYYKENSENGLSIIINGSWGSGKTEFVKDFIKNIDSKRYKVLNIYNSFEYDFYDNAYIPLFSHIKDELNLELDVDRLFNITARYVARKTINITYNATRGLLRRKIGIDLDEIKDAANFINDEYNKAESKYKDFKDLKEIKKSLKKEIEEKSSNKPLILVIDELDRCNPRFAIDTLEIIKYFFDIKNLVVILSLDKEQLEESVKTIYGNGINSDLYFSKFFDYQFNLNKLNFIDIIDFSSIDDAPDIVSSIEHVFSFLNITTRDSFKVFNEFINKYKKYSNKGIKWTKSQCVFALLIILIKNTNLMFYNSIINGTFDEYSEQLVSDNNIDKKKYIELFRFTLFGESNIKKSIQKIIKNGDKEYISLENLNHTSPNTERQNELNTLNEMYLFLPRVIDGGTYLDNYLNIFNN